MSLKQWIKRQVKKVIGRQPPASAPSAPNHPVKRRPAGTHTVKDVVDHYETFASQYHEVYGEVYQAARPYNIEELLQRELETAQIQDGHRVLDAGCGICGPAIWFAKHKQITIDAVTISPAQMTTARQAIVASNLSSRIALHLGDYNKLDELFPANTFDCVYFLESLCHAENYRRVLTSAWMVLKPGGCLYIKDYLKLDLSANPAAQNRADEFLEKAYEEYHFNLIHRKEMLAILAEIGFVLEFLENNPFDGEKEDLSVQVGFEQKVGFHWREGLDLRPIDSVEIRARKPA